MDKFSVKNGCLTITSNDTFDILFSAIYNLEEVSVEVRKELALIVEQGLRNTLKYLETSGALNYAQHNFISSENLAAEAQEDANLARVLRIKNVLGAWVYLATWFLSENCLLKENKESNLTKAKRKAKKDRTTDEQRIQNDLNAIALANNNTLHQLVEGVLKQPIHLLWPNQKVEEEFVKRMLKCGFDFLMVKTRDEDQKNKVFELLQLTIGTYGE